MENIFKNNAYHVLGLDVYSAQREIVKRSKEIINRLKIDDLPEYDADINFFKAIRTEESIKTALQRLQEPKKKIKEYFFWYQGMNEIDENAFLALKKHDYSSAIELWEKSSKKTSSTSFLCKKNLAILYCMLLYEEDNENYLSKSISLWKDIFYSEKFWELFFKSYELSDDQCTSIEILNEFKISMPTYLSDIYTDLHNKYRNPAYINGFQKTFSLKSEKMEKDVLAPLYESINKNIENLEKLDLNKDDTLNTPEMNKVKPLIQAIQTDLNKLTELGLYDDSQTKIIRDKTVEAIRHITLELYNNLDESDKSEDLLNIALKIVGTAGLEEKIKHEINVIQEMKKNQTVIKPVLDLIEQQKYSSALTLIESDMGKYADNQDLFEFYLERKKHCISAIAIKKWGQAHDVFKEKPTGAAPLYAEAGVLIYENIDLFNFNKEAIDNIISDIKIIMQKVTVKNIDQLDEYRNKFVKLATEKFEGKYEETIFIVLIDAYIFGGIANVAKAVKQKNMFNNVVSVASQIVMWVVIVLLISYFRSW